MATRISERLRLLVYLDAYLPEDGQSEADHFAASTAKARARKWEVIDLAAGHLAMIIAPEQVAEILLQKAQ